MTWSARGLRPTGGCLVVVDRDETLGSEPEEWPDDLERFATAGGADGYRQPSRTRRKPRLEVSRSTSAQTSACGPPTLATSRPHGIGCAGRMMTVRRYEG